MSAPKHAIDLRGKGRYYEACGPTCPLAGNPALMSVTNAQSVVNKPGLPPSAAKITAEQAWQLLPQMVATSRQPAAGIPVDGGKLCEGRSPVRTRCGRCRFCITAAIKAEYRLQWETKADFGTLVHRYAHAHVLREPQPPNDDVEPFIEQYLAFLDAWGVDIDQHVEAAETTVVDRANGYAGTGDVWLWLPLTPTGRLSKTRHLWLVDLKTSLTKPAGTVYPDQVLQLAGLRYAPKAILPDDSEVDVPEFAGAALLNLRASEHALIPLPADRDAHQAFLHARGLQGYFHDHDTKAWTPVQAPVVPEPKGRGA